MTREHVELAPQRLAVDGEPFSAHHPGLALQRRMDQVLADGDLDSELHRVSTSGLKLRRAGECATPLPTGHSVHATRSSTRSLLREAPSTRYPRGVTNDTSADSLDSVTSTGTSPPERSDFCCQRERLHQLTPSSDATPSSLPPARFRRFRNRTASRRSRRE